MQPDDTAPTRRQQPADETAPSPGRTEATRKSPGGGAAQPKPAPALAQAPGDLTGQVLSGKYRVVRMLGKGGFGAVYEAKDEMLGASVAVKVLTPEAMQQDDALQQFLGEARLLTSLDHPNVVRWITFDRTASGLHYFVMEILKGSELSDVLDEVSQMPHQRVTTILLQVLSALRAAHFLPDGRSLLHLDLKPRNVFVVKGEPEQIKVIDFGISQHVGAAARSAAGIGPETAAVKKDEDLGATIATISSAADKSFMVSKNGVNRARGGTLLYASPEHCKHLRGDPIIDELDGRSDLYSLGVMAFQMLAGRMPWICRTQNEAFKAHLETPAPLLSKVGVKVPRGLEQFVARCLAKNRDDRYASVKEAYEALDRVANPPSQLPKFAAAGALVAGLAVWQMWPAGSTQEVTVAPNLAFLGPQQATAQLSLGKLSPELANLATRWVVDPQSDTEALPGWNVIIALENGLPRAHLTAPADLTAIVDTEAYLRFGEGATQQHSERVRVVWLPADACSIGEIGVRGAGTRVVDPVGAKLAIDVRVKRDYIDPTRSVQVSLNDQVRNARLDEGTAGTALLFEVPLDDFGFTPDEGEKTADFQIVIRDRAGNEQRRPAALRIDARPLTFKASLDVPADAADFYVLDPNAVPTLRWQSNRTPLVELVARDLQDKDVPITTEPRPDGILLRLPAAKESYQASIQVRANDLDKVHHVDDRRGRSSDVIRYSYEPKGVTFDIEQRHREGGAPARSSTTGTLLTNRDAIILDLTRKEVAVSVEVECRGGAEPWIGKADLHGEGLKSLVIPLGADGRYDVTVRGYRYRGVNMQRTSQPEFVQSFVVRRDTKPPALRLVKPPAEVRGPVDATAACFSVEVGDDSAEPLSLEWTLKGPTPASGSRQIEAGPVRELPITWQQLTTVDPMQLDDGDWTLQLTAVDAAANRSTIVTSEPFVIARRPPTLTLRSPGVGEWIKEPNNTFQVVVQASDKNGVVSVECMLNNKATGEPTKWFSLKPVGADATHCEWRDQIPVPGAWSQQVVELRWKGRDRFGNEAAAGPFEATLQEFQLQRPARISLLIAATTLPPMRLVKGDANYRFGGRTVIEEAEAFTDFGFSLPREFRDQKEKVDDYYLDENEVTVAEYGAFVANGYANEAAYWTDRDERGDRGRPEANRHEELRTIVAEPTRARMPMTGLDWYEAAAYARWADKRLPTKVEWEYATRGGSAYRPFSSAHLGINGVEALNVGKPGSSAWDTGQGVDLTPPGIGGGIRNLCSNVAEWTASPPGNGADRMLTAGGHFARIGPAFHFQIMEPQSPKARLATIGFRCAASARSIDELLEKQGRVIILTPDSSSDPKAR